MSNDRYSMSFTTGSLFHRESMKEAAIYLDYSDWGSVRDNVVAEDLLQTRTQNTLKRIFREATKKNELWTQAENTALGFASVSTVVTRYVSRPLTHFCTTSDETLQFL